MVPIINAAFTDTDDPVQGRRQAMVIGIGDSGSLIDFPFLDDIISIKVILLKLKIF